MARLIPEKRTIHSPASESSVDVSGEAMNNKCVYLHKTKDGIVFYVGSGTQTRASQKELSVHKSTRATGRGTAYSDFVASINFEYDVEIVAKGLSSVDAITLEQKLFDQYKTTIVNKNKPSYERNLDFKLFNDNLYINGQSPSGLSWKTDRHSGNRHKVCRYKAGDAAGFLNSNGYWIVSLNCQDYAAHRVIMTLLGNDLNGYVVDHINKIRSDNSVANLRIISKAENSLNASVRKDNTSGICGVHFNAKSRMWYCRWTEDGQRKIKTFSTLKYGFIPAQSMAVKLRLELDAMLNNTVNKGI